MTKEDEELTRLATKIAALVNKNISEITEVIAKNILEEEPETLISGFAALHTVSSYYEYKMNKMGIPPLAIEKAKNSAENYVLDIIATELGTVAQNKGEA